MKLPLCHGLWTKDTYVKHNRIIICAIGISVKLENRHSTPFRWGSWLFALNTFFAALLLRFVFDCDRNSMFFYPIQQRMGPYNSYTHTTNAVSSPLRGIANIDVLDLWHPAGWSHRLVMIFIKSIVIVTNILFNRIELHSNPTVVDMDNVIMHHQKERQTQIMRQFEEEQNCRFFSSVI